MITTKLKAHINEEVRKNDDVLYAIAKATKKSTSSVRRWFYEDSEMLTNYGCLSVISEHLGKPIEDLLEQSETEKV